MRTYLPHSNVAKGSCVACNKYLVSPHGGVVSEMSSLPQIPRLVSRLTPRRMLVTKNNLVVLAKHATEYRHNEGLRTRVFCSFGKASDVILTSHAREAPATMSHHEGLAVSCRAARTPASIGAV